MDGLAWFFAGTLQVDAPDTQMRLKDYKSQTVSEARNRRISASASEIEPPGNGALGHRSPPEPVVGSGCGGKYELTAIGQPSRAYVCHPGRLNLFLFSQRFVAFSKMQQPQSRIEVVR